MHPGWNGAYCSGHEKYVWVVHLPGTDTGIRTPTNTLKECLPAISIYPHVGVGQTLPGIFCASIGLPTSRRTRLHQALVPQGGFEPPALTISESRSTPELLRKAVRRVTTHDVPDTTVILCGVKSHRVDRVVGFEPTIARTSRRICQLILYATPAPSRNCTCCCTQSRYARDVHTERHRFDSTRSASIHPYTPSIGCVPQSLVCVRLASAHWQVLQTQAIV
jgi:hypothetical protein